MDFTIKQYVQLIKTLQDQSFAFQTFSEFTSNQYPKTIVLRHDVDLLPQNSLRFASIQFDLGIKGTYYFRAVPESWDENIILQIAEMGHEIGYHYETMDTAKGNIDLAWDQFRFHLDKLSELVEVKTICMHGSPRSKFDNREIWTKYHYKSLGLIGEPYFDIDYNKVLYLTDTGRRWDGYKVSLRDKIPDHQERWNHEGLVFQSTKDIISGISKLPDKIMFTFHPQRWHNNFQLWSKELLVQRIKNTAKYLLIKIK